MATRQYYGARYVPVFYENSDGTSEWREGVAYEALTIVTYNGNSYTSKKTVPASVGNPSNNNEFWAPTGMYNEQVESLRDEVAGYRDDVAEYEEVVEEYKTKVDNLDYYANLRGKQIAIYGDSWTIGYSGWRDYLSEITGKPVHTSGIFGGFLSRGEMSVLSAFDNYADADIYIIKGGINDWNKDRSASDVMNGMKDVINAIRSVNANAEIYFTTMVSNLYVPASYIESPVYFPLDAYRQIIWSVAQSKNCKVIDGLNCGIKIAADGFHPLDAHEERLYGKYVANALIIGGNTRSFQNSYRMHTISGNNIIWAIENGKLKYIPWYQLAYDSETHAIRIEDPSIALFKSSFRPVKTIIDNCGSGFFTGYATVNFQAGVFSVDVGGNTKASGSGYIVIGSYALEYTPDSFNDVTTRT